MDGLKTKEDRRFQTFWVIFFILISVIAIIPVLRVISISFSALLDIPLFLWQL